jgi:hypothetical protein
MVGSQSALAVVDAGTEARAIVTYSGGEQSRSARSSLDQGLTGAWRTCGPGGFKGSDQPARRERIVTADSMLASGEFRQSKTKTTEELLGVQKLVQDQLRHYQQALRTARPALKEREQ